MSKFADFIRKNGKPLTEIIPDSKEYALPWDKALEGVQLLKDNHIPIIGGEVMSLDAKGGLNYAYILWDPMYHTLDWSMKKVEGETSEEYARRSYELANEKIMAAKREADALNQACLIVLGPPNTELEE